MEFEFDPGKSTSNKHKHGIDFVVAQALWEDPDRLQVPARTQGELRFMLIGEIRGEHWSAIFTPREDRIQIVSVRRLRTKEVDAYEN
ncbi:BrnT family toxin [Candidatus Bipolaricaulota bacterium]|nr:BrnT family toxin [Candidatus Bipolaricaulota bacterium]